MANAEGPANDDEKSAKAKGKFKKGDESSDKVDEGGGNYGADNIEVLEGLEAVRMRPGMYIGTTGPKGLHHLVYEIVDNSVDEALAGHCKNISVTINEDDSVTVEDDGRGIPIGIVEKTGKSAVETVFTVLHAGGKFGGGGYKVSGGLHGVGASVVNALSEKLEVEVSRDGKQYRQVYKRGIPDGLLQEMGATDKRGTKVRFWPDDEIFHDSEDDVRSRITVQWDVLQQRLREMAFLNKGLCIIFTDNRSTPPKTDTYHYEGGIGSYVEYLNDTKTAVHKPPIYFENTVDRYAEQEKDKPEEEREKVVIECALQWADVYAESSFSFVNNIDTRDGGTHLTGFRMGLVKAINLYAKEAKHVKENDDDFVREDVMEGLTAIVSVKVSDPQFEGQTKERLGNREVQTLVARETNAQMAGWLDLNPKEGKQIIAKIQQAKHAREAAHKARALVRRQSALENSSLPDKLADCSEKDASKCEIYLVEGDSAGGSAKQGRDRTFQAILPLRGKILNVERVQPGRIYENNEVQAMIQALGLSIKEKDEDDDGEPVKASKNKSAGLLRPNATNHDLTKLRYHKVIIMTDADVDGSHIRTLLLTFFFRYARPLVQNGYIYIAQPPLYKVEKGKRTEYCYNEHKLQAVLAEMGDKATIQRFKGLGEMMPQQLWDTTMNPETRTLKKVTVEDATDADHTFDLLMGEAVGPRREFIETNADKGNLDI